MNTPNPHFDLLLQRGLLREQAFGALLRGDGDITIEHKSEPRGIQYGSVFIETSDDGQGPTGLSVSTADWYAIEYAPDRWIVLPTSELRRLCGEVSRLYGFTRGGWEHRSVGVVMPLVRLVARR